jgi:hypothetical protein
MATSVVETPRIVATLPTRPQDGDDAYMDSGAAPIMPVLQHLYDAAGALRIAALGQMTGGDRLSVDAGGTSTVFAVRISRIVGLLSRQTGATPIFATYTAAETVLDLTDVDGSPAALANGTWYYVYAFCNGTATTQAYISTTAPESSLTWRTGAEGVDRYIGCFRTDGSGAPLPVRMHRGRYTYRMSSIGFGGYLSKTITTTAWTAYDFSTGLPPHARIAHLRLFAVDATNPPLVQVRTPGDTTDVYVCQGSATGTPCAATYSVELDSGQDVQAQIANATANASEVDVVGFEE